MTKHIDNRNTLSILDRAHQLRASQGLGAAALLLEETFAKDPDASIGLALGQIQVELGQPAKAITVLQSCIQAQANNADLRFALGVALFELGEAHQAAAAFLKATRIAPERLAPRLMLAKSLMKAGRLTDGLSIMRQTTQDFLTAPEAWALRGLVEREMLDNAAAEKSYRQQLSFVPNDYYALNNHGVCLRALNRFDEAIEQYRKAIAIAPSLALAHANLGNVLDVTGATAEAERHLREAARLDPASVNALYNLAAHLVREEKPAEAIPLLRHVVSIESTRWDAWTNLGVGLIALGSTKEAESCYRTALQLRPTAPEAHYNLAWLLLLTGQWREGWDEYEWRWQLPHMRQSQFFSKSPAWDGIAKPEATILLHCEQGFGDSIQFIRFAQNVRALCKRVAVVCQHGLERLFSSIKGVDEVVPFGAPIPSHDFYAHLLSLPKLLGFTLDSDLGRAPYIQPPLNQNEPQTLSKSPRPRIGFVWAGSPDNKIDRRRSCDASLFVGLFDGLNVELVSLQMGPRAKDISGLLPALTYELNGRASDWRDTAAVVNELDLVIGVDTGVMHLAGALGRPTWILLPSSPDFRWLLDRTDCPWYSSFSLYRQEVSGDWASLFIVLRHDLTNWLEKRA